jgi:hypothetical protein
MNSLLSRKCYATNELAIAGAIEQMGLVGFAETVEQRNIKSEARASARHRAGVKHDELMAKLRNQNNEAIKVKALTKEMVYPKARLSK